VRFTGSWASMLGPPHDIRVPGAWRRGRGTALTVALPATGPSGCGTNFALRGWRERRFLLQSCPAARVIATFAFV